MGSYYLKSLSSYWPIAKILSENQLSALFLFTQLLSVPVRKRLFGRTPKRIKISYGPYKNISFFVRDGADISTLREVFVEGEYETNPNILYKPKQIRDIGAHIGSACLYFSAKYPDALIVAYEPDVENFKVLLMNMRPLINVHMIRAGVSATGGDQILYRNPDSSTKGSVISKTKEKIKIETISFSEVINGGADFIKFDEKVMAIDSFSSTYHLLLSKVFYYIGKFYLDTKEYKESFEGLFPLHKIDLKYSGDSVFVSIKHKSLQVLD